MKKIYVVLLLLVLGCTSSSMRQNSGVDVNMYRKAYKYILESKAVAQFVEGIEDVAGEVRISVADSVVFLEASAFAEKISRQSDARFEEVLDSLMAADSVASLLGYHVTELVTLGSKQNEPLILFFSRPRGNVLLAELFFRYDYEDDYRRIAALNRGLLFMLRFDDSGMIDESSATVIEYN